MSSIYSWALGYSLCHLFAHASPAALESFAGNTARFFKASLIVATVEAQDLASRQTLYQEIAKATAQNCGIGPEKVQAWGACLVNCDAVPSFGSALLEEDTGKAGNFTILDGVVEVAVAVTWPTMSIVDEGMCLKGFENGGSQNIVDAIRFNSGMLNDTVFATSQTIAYYEPNPEGSQFPMKLITNGSMGSLIYNGNVAKSCYYSVLAGQLLYKYWDVLSIAAVDATRAAGGTEHEVTFCKQKAIALLRHNCVDLDVNVSDSWGASCVYYSIHGREMCGQFDDEDFSANFHCCMCGGGGTLAALKETMGNLEASEEATAPVNPACRDTLLAPSNGPPETCFVYAEHPEKCGKLDTDSFKARTLCCACGGGFIDVNWKSVTPAPTPQMTFLDHGVAYNTSGLWWVYAKMDISLPNQDYKPGVYSKVVDAAESSLVAITGVEKQNVIFHVGIEHDKLLGVVTRTDERTATQIEKDLKASQIKFLKMFQEKVDPIFEGSNASVNVTDIVIGRKLA